ncbi:MAG TPA: glycine zipper domain-containing protein [Thermoanaerobaculia bacterium]
MGNEGQRTAGAKVGTGTLDAERENGHDANRDPLTGEPGAHPVGTGVGAATGGTVGAVIGGAVGGPVGMMIGAAVGGLTGGFAGKEIAESINPTEEDAYWRENYASRPYAAQSQSYEDLQAAYRYGWESRSRYPDQTWDQVENDLERDWERAKGNSRLSWHEAKHATRDAWQRIDRRLSQGTSESPALSVVYSHEDYRPAYWYGWEAAQKHGGRRWVDVESDLERGWDRAKGSSRLPWREAESPVREAWNQAVALQTRPKAAPLAVDLRELHDPETGRLDAARVADYLKLPLKQLSEALGRNYSTVHRTPTAPAIQETLRSIKRSLEILGEVLGDRASVLAWWNSPHPDLGRKTPMQVLLEGRAQVIEDMLEAALEGIPS